MAIMEVILENGRDGETKTKQVPNSGMLYVGKEYSGKTVKFALEVIDNDS